MRGIFCEDGVSFSLRKPFQLCESFRLLDILALVAYQRRVLAIHRVDFRHIQDHDFDVNGVIGTHGQRDLCDRDSRLARADLGVLVRKERKRQLRSRSGT